MKHSPKSASSYTIESLKSKNEDEYKFCPRGMVHGTLFRLPLCAHVICYFENGQFLVFYSFFFLRVFKEKIHEHYNRNNAVYE